MPQARDEAGNIWEVDAQGNAIRLISSAQSVQTKPVDQKLPAELQKLTNQAQASEYDPQAAAADLAVKQQQLVINQAKEARDQAIFEKTGGLGADAQAAANKQAERDKKGQFILGTVANMEQLYNQDLRGQPVKRGFGATEYIDGLPSNERFKVAGQTLLGLVRPMIASSAKEGDSDREMAAFEAYLPTNDDTDATIEYKFKALRALVGGIIDGKSATETQAMLQTGANPSDLGGDVDKSTPLSQIPSGDQKFFNPSGQNKIGTGNYATDKDKAIQTQLQTMLERGASAAEIKQAITDSGYGNIYRTDMVQDAVDYRDGTGKYANQGPQGGAGFEIPTTGERGQTQELINKALLSPQGTLAASTVSGLGFGALEGFNPEAFAQLRETNPNAALGGDILGTIGGVGAISALGRAASKRAAPSLLGGGAKAVAGRNLAADATYGGLYSQNTGGDPLTGATLSAGGSILGRGVGSGVGKAVSGVTDPAVQYLSKRGIPLTLGQMAGNKGPVGGFLNKLESLPVVGDLASGTKREGLAAFEREYINDALSSLGKRVQTGGAEGIRGAQDAIRRGYADALDNKIIPGDEQFTTQLGTALREGSQIPVVGEQFNYVTNKRIKPLLGGDSISGKDFQSGVQSLRKARSDFGNQGAMGVEAADALGQIDDAFTGLVGRQAPDVLTKFNAAQDAYKAMSPFEKAAMTAVNQSHVTPAQVQRAITSNTKKFGGQGAAARGDNLTDLTRYGQEVLPSTVPDSGTAGRLLAAGALPAVFGAGSAGSAFFTDSPETTATLGLLAAMSTKTGAKALQKALTSRPSAVRKAGKVLRGKRSKSIFGSAFGAPALREGN